MSVLLFVSEVDGEPPADSALTRSLAAQRDPRWTTDPSASVVVATAMLDHDTTLHPDAVEALHQALDDPGIAAVIADATVGGERRLRPAWSPTALGATLGELDLVVARGVHPAGTLADRVEVLAATSSAAIAHLPAPLIERAEPVPVGEDAVAAVRRFVGDRASLDAPASVSFVIPTAGGRHPDGRRFVDAAVDAARAAGVDDMEILVVVGPEFDGDPSDLAGPDLAVVRRDTAWNFATTMNLGLLAATKDAVVVLNDDVEVLEPGWLLPMLDHLRDPGIGLVGAALLYPDHTVQHLGVVIDDAVPLHPHVGRRVEDLPASVMAAHEVAAVTAACAVARRRDLLEVGGFFTGLPVSFNDVDLAYKIHRAGRRVVVEPAAQLVHHESASREPVIERWEWERFVGRWGEIVDPWYHPGHHRPDEPENRRRNADHLPPDDPAGWWPLRTTAIQPRVHRARL